MFDLDYVGCPFRGLAPAGQSSPLRSEHEQPALRAAGSTCCYDQKKRSTNLIIYNQIGKCTFRGLAACAAKFSAALRTRTAPRSARRCWCTFRGLAPAGQSSPLRSEHEQPALRAAGSTCCYDQKETGRRKSSCFFLVHLQGLEPGTH